MTPGENTDPFVKGPEPRTGNAQGRGERRPAGPDAAIGEPSLTRDGTPISTPPAGDSSTPPAGGSAGSDERGADVAEDLDALLADVEKQRDEYLELAQRTKADFENYRKRMTAEVQAAALRGKAELATGLIRVIDTLELALSAAGIDLTGSEAPEDGLAEGVLLTHRQLCETLEGAGVESYDPAGEAFDPTWHEALQKLKVEGTESGRVVEVVQKGYRLNDQVLRAARVVVSE